jgi:hypothetical protein
MLAVDARDSPEWTPNPYYLHVAEVWLDRDLRLRGCLTNCRGLFYL